MPSLIWDKIEDRVYETGLDRGVLYLPDGSAVPWNGLTSVIEKFDKDAVPIYYDGMKISDLVSLGDFSASMKAVTYPDEFVEIEGVANVRRGVFLGDQNPQVFALCYRTQVGNALEGDIVGYKIHIIYNVTAIPNDRTYATVSSDPSLVEFEWNITAVPEEVPGYRPTAHIIIDSMDLDPWLLEDLEKILYGNSNAFAALIPMPDLFTYMSEWYRVKITDNGDGTWTATSQRDGFISFSFVDLFQITHINAIYINDFTFVISDTLDAEDVPQIDIIDNDDGTWTATTEHDGLISVNIDGTFQILNANLIYITSELYQLENTTDN